MLLDWDHHFNDEEWEDPFPDLVDGCSKQYSVKKFSNHPNIHMSYDEDVVPQYVLYTRICPVCGDEISKQIDVPAHWSKYDGKWHRVKYESKIAYKKLKDFSVSRLCCKGECENVAGQRECDRDVERERMSHKEEDRNLIAIKEKELEESKVRRDHDKIIKIKIDVLNQLTREYKEKYGESPFS